MEKIKECFIAKNSDDKELNITVVFPTNKNLQDAQMIYNVKMSELIRKGELLSRNQLDSYLNKLGLWTTEDQLLFIKMQKELREMEKILITTEIGTLDGRKIAIEMRTKREIMLSVYNKRSQFDETTMESVAEQYRFNFLITKCVIDTVSETCIYKNIDDYIDKQNEQYSVDAAKILAAFIFGYKKDFVKQLPENKWLKNNNFINEDGAFINIDGNLIDISGRKIDKNGRFVDDEGNYIDIEGNPVDTNGEFIVKTEEIKIPKKTRKSMKV
jgi:hypothetical protein